MLNAEADIPVEELLRLYHPELYDEQPEKSDKPDSPKKKKKLKKRPEDKTSGKSSSDDEAEKSTAEESNDQVSLKVRIRINVTILVSSPSYPSSSYSPNTIIVLISIFIGLLPPVPCYFLCLRP